MSFDWHCQFQFQMFDLPKKSICHVHSQIYILSLATYFPIEYLSLEAGRGEDWIKASQKSFFSSLEIQRSKVYLYSFNVLVCEKAYDCYFIYSSADRTNLVLKIDDSFHVNAATTT